MMGHECRTLFTLFVGLALSFHLPATEVKDYWGFYEPFEFTVIETDYERARGVKPAEEVVVTIINDKETYDIVYRTLHDDLAFDYENSDHLDFEYGTVLWIDLACVGLAEYQIHVVGVARIFEKISITFGRNTPREDWRAGPPGTTLYMLIHVNKKIRTPISAPDAVQLTVCGG